MHTVQLLPGPDCSGYVRARLEIQERLDGSVVLAYQGKVIASKEAPPHPAKLRTRKRAWRQTIERDVAGTLEVDPREDGDRGAVWQRLAPSPLEKAFGGDKIIDIRVRY